ncbi:MAG: HigA family addiction module antitoxin [Sulfuricellaceae bacterium]
MNRLHNIHPGEVLREEFLIPLGLSQYWLAKEIGVTEARISAICSGKRSITTDTALRLAAFSARRPHSGWDCKPTMTRKKLQFRCLKYSAEFIASSVWQPDISAVNAARCATGSRHTPRRNPRRPSLLKQTGLVIAQDFICATFIQVGEILATLGYAHDGIKRNHRSILLA